MNKQKYWREHLAEWVERGEDCPLCGAKGSLYEIEAAVEPRWRCEAPNCRRIVTLRMMSGKR